VRVQDLRQDDPAQGEGMSLGSAVRIHYWRDHPEIMRGKPKSKTRARAKV
jgi:hypothetical protein